MTAQLSPDRRELLREALLVLSDGQVHTMGEIWATLLSRTFGPDEISTREWRFTAMSRFQDSNVVRRVHRSSRKGGTSYQLAIDPLTEVEAIDAIIDRCWPPEPTLPSLPNPTPEPESQPDRSGDSAGEEAMSALEAMLDRNLGTIATILESNNARFDRIENVVGTLRDEVRECLTHIKALQEAQAQAPTPASPAVEGLRQSVEALAKTVDKRSDQARSEAREMRKIVELEGEGYMKMVKTIKTFHAGLRENLLSFQLTVIELLGGRLGRDRNGNIAAYMPPGAGGGNVGLLAALEIDKKKGGGG
jgi:hypothetical protein